MPGQQFLWGCEQCSSCDASQRNRKFHSVAGKNERRVNSAATGSRQVSPREIMGTDRLVLHNPSVSFCAQSMTTPCFRIEQDAWVPHRIPGRAMGSLLSLWAPSTFTSRE